MTQGGAASALFRGSGTTAVYGTSPAVDLLANGASPSESGSDTSTTVKLLVVAANDCRHMLKTIGDRWAVDGERRPLHVRVGFFIIEPQAPGIARWLLQLSLVLDETWKDLSMQDKTEVFLELYGNCFVREKTAQMLTEQATKLINIVSDGELTSQDQWACTLDFSQLKFRERDDVEFTLQFWRNTKKSFDMEKLRDLRMRSYYGIRYDSRDNLFDWDYQMKLKDKAPIIHPKEFSRWRETGVAFEVRDSNYSHPNRSMATVDGMKEDGLTVTKWGYFSDIILSPYIGFGIESDNKDFFKKQNDKFMHISQQVAEYNVRKYMQQLYTGVLYDGSKPAAITETLEEDVTPSRPPLSNVRVTFLPCDLQQTFAKAKYHEMFDVVYLGNMMAHRIVDAPQLLRRGGKLHAENAQFMIDLDKEQVASFHRKMQEMAKEGGLRQVGKDVSHHFTYEREPIEE